MTAQFVSTEALATLTGYAGYPARLKIRKFLKSTWSSKTHIPEGPIKGNTRNCNTIDGSLIHAISCGVVRLGPRFKTI